MATTGTYGLGTSVRTGAGVGPGLASTGIDQKRAAMGMLGDAAPDDLDDAEIERSIREINEAIQRSSQRKN